MAPKIIPPSMGNLKATPTPLRYKDGEAPLLPDWPINWSCVGICIETLLAINADTLIEAINGMRPAYSMAIVDANIMAFEEMALNPPTILGVKLKDAMASKDPSWLSPQLLSEVFEARSMLDKDDEHRREAQRRINAAELYKKELEEALKKESEVKVQFEEALLKQKEFEDKMREAEEAAKKTQSGCPEVAVVTSKEKPPLPSKGARPIPINNLDEQRKALEEKTAKLRDILQCFETKVKVAQYWDVKGDYEKDDPMTTTRIYWCIGFGSTPVTLSDQVTVKNIFKAIFNIAKKPLPQPPFEIEGALDKNSSIGTNPPLKTSTSENPNSILFEPIPLSPFIQELFELAKISKHGHPSKMLPVINVLYEDPPLESPLNEGAQAFNKAPPPAISKKPIQAICSLPYEQIAKAITKATIFLKEQVEAFALLEESVTESCIIPETIPIKDVNMTYYKALLDEAPLDLISIPIIVHCIVEQVSIYECLPEDIEDLEIAKENHCLAKSLNNTFHKLGQGLFCMKNPSDILMNLMERIEAEIKRELKEREEARRKALEVERIVAQGALEDQSLVHTHAKPTLELANQENPFGTTDSEKNKSLLLQREKRLSAVASLIITQPFSKKGGSMLQDPRIIALTEIEDDESQTSELSGGSSTKIQDNKDRLLIVHEFDRVGRLEALVEKQELSFWNSIDIVKVEKHMLSLLVYPGIKRAHMPIIPVLSAEKRHQCIEALEMCANGGPQVEGKGYYKELDDIYGPGVIVEVVEEATSSMIPVNIAIVKRYQKLKMFLEMLLEDHREVFQIHDTPVEEMNIDVEDASKLDDGLTNEQRKEHEKEKYLVDCGCPGVKIYRFPTPEPSMSSLSSSSSNLENMLLIFQKILDRNFNESFPNGFLGKIYGKAKNCFPFRIRRYDRDEDCILEALYVDERNHEWEGTIASQMGFGEFIANLNTPLPSMLVHNKHATYDVEQQDATIIERFRCHLTENQGLVWVGLPAKSIVQWEPQTTVIKDGNMIFLRGYGPNDNSESPTIKGVYAILEDGLVVCFSIGVDGTMNMQMTNSTSKTIEISSSGIILMYPSHLHTKSELEENESEKEIQIKDVEKGTPKKVVEKEPPKKVVEKEPPKKVVEKGAPKKVVEKDTSKEENSELETKSGIRTNNIQTIRNILLQEKGDVEAWRCILPSGTVVRYKRNGDAQILCRQGNVSDWRSDFEGGPCWITTNNEGFLVVQEDPPIEDTPPQPIEETTTNIEPKEEVKPILTTLPNLKVAHFYDPHTKDEITTREDLVVIVECEEQNSSLVQHADGTHIYSEVRKFFPRVLEEIVYGDGESSSSSQGSESTVLDDEKNESQISSPVNNEQSANIAKDPHHYHPPVDPQRMHNHCIHLCRQCKEPNIEVDYDYYDEEDEEKCVEPLEPQYGEPQYSIVWHVRKDGLAKVHGKVGAGTCVEFETEDGHYTATWSQKNSLLSLTIPGGATLSTTGNIVNYSPSTKSESKNDILKSESINNTNDDGTTSEDSNKDVEKQTNDMGEENNEKPLLNTYGCYSFDVVEGSLLFTNTTGDGFKVFGRGTEFEKIIEGKLTSRLEREAIELQMKLEMTELARQIAECFLRQWSELAICSAKECKFIPESQLDVCNIEPPPSIPTPPSTPSLTSSEPLEREILGPFPRLFVIYEKGYGYEILGEEIYQLYKVAKFYDKYCTRSDNTYNLSNEECLLHTFVTIVLKNNMSVNDYLKDEEKTQTSFPVTPWLLTRKVSQFARKFEAKQRNNKVQKQTDCDWLQLHFMLPNLPRIINPVLPKLHEGYDNSTFVFRQFIENPSISKEASKNTDKILEVYSQWLVENIDTPETTYETRCDRDIEVEKFSAITQSKKLAEHEVQKARNQYSLQIHDARHVVSEKLREIAHIVDEAARQQRLVQEEIDRDWKRFVESKGGPFVCMHKPIDLLQTEPPFHPLPNIRFLYFHVEEGLRYLFICQQKLNEANRWSIETMAPSTKSSIHSNEHCQELTEVEEKELGNMFSEMWSRVEELSKVMKAEEDEKKQREEDMFCKQIFSKLRTVPKTSFHDFKSDDPTSSDSENEETCIFDYPPKPIKKPKLRPPHVYEISPALPRQPPEPCDLCVKPKTPPTPPCDSSLQVCPIESVPPSPPPILEPKPQELSQEEKNIFAQLAREAWLAQRKAEKELRLKTLGPDWPIPQEFDNDYEKYMRARAFKKAFQVAKCTINEPYLTRELPNEREMRMEYNERMKISHEPLSDKPMNSLEWVQRQFRIFPPFIDFHYVQLGTMKMKIVMVQNYHGPRCGRIFIHKEDKLSIKFHYVHGAIAPGMCIILRVFFRASKLGDFFNEAEIRTDNDVLILPIKAIVISGVALPDPSDQIEVIVRNPCDEPIDPWGTFILCRRCLEHHLHWWSKNWGLYECTKCWHFHITQEWLDAIAEKEKQEKNKLLELGTWT